MQLPLFRTTTKVEVSKITIKEARGFLARHHYLGESTANSAQCYAISEEDKIVAVVTFSTIAASPAARETVLPVTGKHVMELSRLAIAPECRLKATQVMNKVIDFWRKDRAKRRMTPIYALVSYADSDQEHHGGVYQAASWVYVGETKANRVFFKDQEGRLRYPRNCGHNITREEAEERGWKVHRSGAKHKYIKPLNKSARRIVGEGLPYPKPRA